MFEDSALKVCSHTLVTGFGFNSGSALLLPIDQKGLVAANSAVATALSAAAGGIGALFTNLVLEERRTGEYRFIMLMATNGALSGLVAITSGCTVVEPWAAVVIGIVAGWNYLWSACLLEHLKIDDAVNAIPVHMVNGIWGMIATGLLASPRLQRLTYEKDDNPGLFYSFGQGNANGRLLACQVIAALFIVGWTLVTMLPFFIFLNVKGWLRSDTYEEIVGLDVSYHGGGMRLSVDDGAGIQFVEAHRRRKLEEERKHHEEEKAPTSPPNQDDTLESKPDGGNATAETDHSGEEVPVEIQDAFVPMTSPLPLRSARIDALEIEEPSTTSMLESGVFYG